MVSKRRGKRKSPSGGLVFEVSDDDVSPDNSDSDCKEPESKIPKTDSKFVESVVNALSNLENENTEIKSADKDGENKEIKPTDKKGEDTEINSVDQDILDERTVENNVGILNVEETPSLEILDYITPNVDFEEGELVTESIDEKDSVNQTIEINFSNEDISNVYKSEFIKFINTFTDLRIIKEGKLSITLRREISDWVNLDETGFIDSIHLPNTSDTDNHLKPSNAGNTEKNLKRKKKKKTKKAKELFVLDTTPSHHESAGCAKYMSKFNIELNENNEEEKMKISSQICFNCEQDHALRDCPLPKDHVKINLMRQRFKKDKQTSRYHLEEDQKYAHLRPGTISDNLRDALGLKKNQLPPYLYQMRLLGYPPGWLEEAKVVYSNLALFDTEGKNVRSENTKKNQGLDSSKIIEYPGFNVPMNKDCKDEYRQYRVPPYSENYSKSAMIEYFEKEYSKQQDDFHIEDMEIDADKEDKEEPVNGRLLKLDKSLKDVDKDAPSPSLVDLETQKQTLLAALDDNSNSNLKSEENTNDLPTSKPIEDNEEPPDGYTVMPSQDSAIPEDINTQNSELHSQNSEKFSQNLLQVTSDEETCSQSTSSKNKSVLNSSFGTPILKSNSPYSRLPNPDNFMKDVSPVINFENLPNSTGKYEQMTGLLQKVRNTMKNLQKCDPS